MTSAANNGTGSGVTGVIPVSFLKCFERSKRKYFP